MKRQMTAATVMADLGASRNAGYPSSTSGGGDDADDDDGGAGSVGIGHCLGCSSYWNWRHSC